MAEATKPASPLERLMGFRLRPNPEMTPARHVRAIASAVVGMVLGAAIWMLSPQITGELEPWDSASWYYFSALVGSGFIATLVYPRSLWRGAFGVYFGQLLFIFYQSATLDRTPMFSPILAVALFGLLPAVFGAVPPHLAWRVMRRNESKAA